MKKTKESENKKSNIKIYPIYKMVSWDLLFYYSIIYLFLTQIKGFSASQVLISEAFFTASCLILQIPLGLLVDKKGKRNSLIIGNIFMCIFSFLLIIVHSYWQLLFCFFLDAVGYVIKGICETNILYDSLPRSSRRGKLYSTIDGTGAARFYITDAVTSIIAGITYTINAYIPMILCFLGNVVAMILCTRFKSIENKEREKDEQNRTEKYFKDLKEALKFAKKSKRMKSLLLFFGIISGLIYNMTMLRGGVLEQIQIPERYFGMIFAISQIVAAIFSSSQNIINRKLKNHTLTYLGVPFTFSCIIIGLLANCNKSFETVFFIIMLFIMQGAIKGAYNVLIYRYLNNFTNRKVRIKLAVIRNMVYNISSIIISLSGAALLSFTNASNTILTIGCFTALIIVLLLDYMRDKVGLEPDKYKKEDLKYSLNSNEEVKN